MGPDDRGSRRRAAVDFNAVRKERKVKHKTPYLVVERPCNSATVDFLSDNVSVEMTIVDGKLKIVVRVQTDDSGYIWKQEEFVIDCE